LTRRRTREQDNDEDDIAKLEDDLDDDLAEEDEVTRCICGYQEYPGLPSDAGKPGSALPDIDVPGDDLGGLFIQCDICKVWQHGGCVGIMQEEASPDEYFCEICKKELHKVTVSPKGYVALPPTIATPTHSATLSSRTPDLFCGRSARRVKLYLQSEATLTYPPTAKSTPAIYQFTTSNMAMPATRPYRKTATSHPAETKIVVQELASIPSANAGLP
jgi:hypothetical protein